MSEHSSLEDLDESIDSSLAADSIDGKIGAEINNIGFLKMTCYICIGFLCVIRR